MVLKELTKIWNAEVCRDFDQEKVTKQFKNFSEEFIRVYNDIETDENLFVGAVARPYALNC